VGTAFPRILDSTAPDLTVNSFPPTHETSVLCLQWTESNCVIFSACIGNYYKMVLAADPSCALFLIPEAHKITSGNGTLLAYSAS
jgi:hypothetical protein